MILLISIRLVAWLIPHLIADNSASIEVMLTAWWSVLITGLLWTWTCKIDVATWFLILASDTMSAIVESIEDLMAMLLSEQIWALRLLLPCLDERWKKR